jgi:glycosyltransferase involved in cell wall biosynthesis
MARVKLDHFFVGFDNSSVWVGNNVSDYPFVSVVVPVFNGADTVEELLLSLLALDYPAERHEIIVVDNGSTDRTREIVGRYPVSLLEERETQGASAARNKGITHAWGDIIAFTDADCVADRDWLRFLVADHGDPSIGGFAGEIRGHEPARSRIEALYNRRHLLSPFRFEEADDGTRKVVLKRRAPVQPRTSLERLWVRLGLVTYYRKRPPIPPLHHAATANVAYRRSVFDEVGLFDVDLLRGQDPDFSWRMQLNSSYRFHPAPKAIIYHKHRTTVSDFFSQRRKHGLARILILDKYVGLEPDVRRQALLESCLNLVCVCPYTLAVLGYRIARTLIYGRPCPMYLYETLISLLSDVGYNYGRIKALAEMADSRGRNLIAADRNAQGLTRPNTNSSSREDQRGVST